LTAAYPGTSDGIALTGFSQNGSFSVEFVLGGNFIQANKIAALSSYPNGYFASSDVTGVQVNFFAPNRFNPDILTLAYSTGQPVTVGELLSFGGETDSINKFAGPTLIIMGERDIPYCGGRCLVAPTGFGSIPAQSLPKFPNAKNHKVVIVPNAGHGLNLEYSHLQTYGAILDYFVNHGLIASA
jgi:pimeloyl-ACP methyl ester carboxylesterase